MKAKQLQLCGLLLYGRRYRNDLANAMNINERTLRRWIEQDQDLPDDVQALAIHLIRVHQSKLTQLHDKLASQQVA